MKSIELSCLAALVLAAGCHPRDERAYAPISSKDLVWTTASKVSKADPEQVADLYVAALADDAGRLRYLARVLVMDSLWISRSSALNVIAGIGQTPFGRVDAAARLRALNRILRSHIEVADACVQGSLPGRVSNGEVFFLTLPVEEVCRYAPALQIDGERKDVLESCANLKRERHLMLEPVRQSLNEGGAKPASAETLARLKTYLSTARDLSGHLSKSTNMTGKHSVPRKRG
jgi:hypothetical protein